MDKDLIKDEINKRGIKTFVHFTHIDNLSSILKNGVLSIDEMGRHGINYHRIDENRFDRRTNWISTSITEINSCMFWQKCIEKNLNPDDYVILFLDPLYIIDNTRYCFTSINAASKEVANGVLYDTYNSFLSMFNDTGRKDTLLANQTTNVQAEVMVERCIPAKAIKSIAFRSYKKYCEFCINHQDTFKEIRNDIYFDYSNYAKKYFDTRKEAS